jgi:hypothetical protein
MKYFIIFAFVSICATVPVYVHGQIPLDDVPVDIRISFMEDFISAADVVYNKNGDLYIFSFRHHSHYKTAAYKTSGERLYVTTDISQARVPQAVLDAVRNEFSGDYVVDQIILKETPHTSVYDFRILQDSSLLTISIRP